MFPLRRILLKLIWIADLLAGPVYRVYLLLFKSVDVSFFADVKLHQFSSFNFGRRIIIEKGCMLHATDSSKIRLGDGVIIQANTHLLNYAGKGITVGNNTTINRYCLLYGHGGLNIGDDCLIGPRCAFIPSNHRFDDTSMKISQQGDTRNGIVVGNNVWFGANVTVLDGVHIGDNCVIGAGAVVTSSIRANSVVVGVPARIVKTREEQPASVSHVPVGSLARESGEASLERAVTRD